MSFIDTLREIFGGGAPITTDERVASLARDVAALPGEERETLGKRLVEAGLFTGVGLYDPDNDLSPSGGGNMYFRRLSKSTRELNPLVQERSIEIAAYLYDSNPLAKRIVELTRDYVVGEGVRFSVASDKEDTKLLEAAKPSEVPKKSQPQSDPRQEELQNVIDDFVDDPSNRIDLRIFDKTLDLAVFGEQVWPVFVNPVDGSVRITSIDPGSIKDVLTDDLDSDAPTDIILKTMGSGIGTETPSKATDVRLKVVTFDTNPQSPTYGRMHGVDTDEQGNVTTQFVVKNDRGVPVRNPDGSLQIGTYSGQCFYFAINKLSTTRRGRSDLLSLLDWVDAYDQLLFGEVDRGLLMRAFIWDVTFQGGDAKQIEDYLRENGQPKPGSVRGHNEKITWNAVSPNLQASDVAVGADLLHSYISSGAGHPKTWTNGMMDVNRASADGMETPAVKRLTARQKFVRYMWEHVLTFVLDQAELHKIIAKRANSTGKTRPSPWKITTIMPEIVANDLQTAGTTLLAVAQACAAARADKAIDVQLEQEVLALVIGQFGIEVDLEGMRLRLEQEAQDSAKKQQDMTTRDPAVNTQLSVLTRANGGNAQAQQNGVKAPKVAFVSTANPNGNNGNNGNNGK